MDDYPSTTYENVVMVHNILVKNNIDEVIFITAPFHSRRANLIWKKNFPDIKITNVKVIDSPDKFKWGADWSTIKIIIYEYLSIIYNYFKGRL